MSFVILPQLPLQPVIAIIIRIISNTPGTKHLSQTVAAVPLPMEVREDAPSTAGVEPERLRARPEEAQRTGGATRHGARCAGHRQLPRRVYGETQAGAYD